MTEIDMTQDEFQEISLAIIDDNVATLKSALAGGADPNARDADWGSTPLIFAALLGRAEIAKLLVAAGADMHMADSYGNNALMLAEIDWETTEAIANAQHIPLTNPDAIRAGKAEIAKMIHASS